MVLADRALIGLNFEALTRPLTSMEKITLQTLCSSLVLDRVDTVKVYKSRVPRRAVCRGVGTVSNLPQA